MFEFAEITKDMTAAEILNYYRNLYYAEPQVTERGIVANAINDYFKEVAPRAEVAREICCKIEEEIVAALESNYRARKEHLERHAEFAYDTELLLEINGKINALRGMEAFVEELKKKYAEGER